MGRINELIKSLPKEDIKKANALLNKKDFFNLSYLVWADLSRAKRENSGNIKELTELNNILSSR